jgi:hypothetical protein
MLIAFHTKHIMGAVDLKASLPLRVDFIELGGEVGGRRKVLGSLQGHGAEAGLPRLPPGREGGSQRHAGPSTDSPALKE